ncbi:MULTISPECIES: hypothetical protein [Azospirillum]|uniref:Uncharacterized protein n=1 Tax=Azospirillum brasilense TaxID=192 RepID=A0A559RUF0_AZOBR|nr:MULTISPECIES: hypothetical protein [Azospirillum]MDW7556029.1 hypothetical protein [Azospirillum brasilense]MDW7595401.1 hypothetical protein [Azospirillum brasilense]MDW7630122.1 hypothetical protein [Azospirillum brasilense]MDX5951757.1 hypothetical protein [Azospirillum brasilense]TVZ53736.1 hypothetical protein OH82_04310 [Azospirillum brasilense]
MFELIYIGLCLLVGFLGIGRRGGFLLYAFLAVVLTPPGALLVMILLTTRAKKRAKA